LTRSRISSLACRAAVAAATDEPLVEFLKSQTNSIIRILKNQNFSTVTRMRILSSSHRAPVAAATDAALVNFFESQLYSQEIQQI